LHTILAISPVSAAAISRRRSSRLLVVGIVVSSQAAVCSRIFYLNGTGSGIIPWSARETARRENP